MRGHLLRKAFSFLIIFSLVLQQAVFAQGLGQLDISRYMAQTSAGVKADICNPLKMRSFSYNPLTDNFQIFVDKGDLKAVKDSQIKEQSKELLKYFLTGVSLADEKFWVNLRPDSENNIIDSVLARTDFGKVMLEADVQLKKDLARFTSPETKEGKIYWEKLYKKANEIFKSENVTIPTLTRPWIVPGEVIIRETADSAYVYKASLNVMLEQDYLKDSKDYNFSDSRTKALNEYSSQLIRETIIPKLITEVNSSARYAQLRQVFYSLVLSRWFKARFAGKSGTYSNLINSGNLKGLTSKQSWSKTTYYNEYKKSFNNGEYNIKEQVNGATGPVIRSYFSGGVALGKMPTGTVGAFNGSSSGVTSVINRDLVPYAVTPKGELSSTVSSGIATEPIGMDNSRRFYQEIEKQGNVIVIGANARSPFVLDGLFKAAKETGKAIVIQRSISEFVKGYLPRDLARDASAAAERVGYTGSWMLKIDHGTVVEDTQAAIDKVIMFINMAKEAGFGSFSIDCSKLVDFSKATESEQQRRNYEVTAQIVKATGIENSAWEGEIGEIVGTHKALSTVAEAVAFLEGIESQGVRVPALMAINNGSEHGNVPGMKIALDRTKEIGDVIYARWGTRINQHGITGTKLELFPVLAGVGIRNGNIATHWQNIEWNVIGKERPDILARAMAFAEVTDLNDSAQSKVWDKKIRNFEPELATLIDDNTKAAITEAVYVSAKEHFEATNAASVDLSSSNTVSSGVTRPGGIDFKVVPFVTKPMGSFSGLDFNLPRLSKVQLNSINIDAEFSQISSMVSSGIRPSDQRLTEVVAACIQKNQLNQYLDKIVALTMNICNSEALKAVKTSDGLKQIMIVLDSRN